MPSLGRGPRCSATSWVGHSPLCTACLSHAARGLGFQARLLQGVLEHA